MENWKTALKEKLRQPLVFPQVRVHRVLQMLLFWGVEIRIRCEKERVKTVDLAFQGVKGKLVLMKHVQSLTFEMTQCTVSIANLRKLKYFWVQNLFFLKTSFSKRKGKILCDTKLHT